jgi:hypothetical protein
MPRPGRFTPGKTRYPLHMRLGGPQGRSGQVRKILPHTGIRFPDRPARSESLYRLSYRAPHTIIHKQIIINFVLLLHILTHVYLLNVIVQLNRLLHSLVFLHDN